MILSTKLINLTSLSLNLGKTLDR